MASTLFILNDAPYGNERAYNALRLAAALAGKRGQKVPEGYYNAQLMLRKVLRKGDVALCGTCMDARGLGEGDVIEGALRSTLAQLADWTIAADKVLVF